MKRVFFSFFLFLSALIQAKENGPSPLEINNIQYQNEEQNVRTLASIGKSYMDLLNRIGADQNLSHEKEAFALCTPNCKKIVNGALWYENIEQFVPQLLSTGEKVGFWSIEPLDLIPGQDGRTVVVRFLVHTERAGVWNTLVILHCNDDLQITEINEIFNSYEGIR